MGIDRADEMSDVLPAFREGAIAPIVQGFLTARLAELAGDYPVSKHHRRLVRQLGGEFVYAAPLRGKFENRWLVLLRFGRVVEGRFGLAAEVPVIYDHHADLQIRTVDSIPEYLRILPDDRQTVSPEICFLSSPDSQLEEKAQRWSRPDRLLVAMPIGDQFGPEELLTRISRLIFTRDLYSVRGAVTGRDFFGRQRLISSVLDDIQHYRVPGIFGMRKSGKTSLIQEMIRATRASDLRSGRRRVFVYQDLEHLSGFDAADPVSELVVDLAESIRSGLKEAGLRTMELAELSNTASLPEFRSALDALLRRLDGGEIVLVLDEVEYLCPPSAERQVGTASSQKVPQLFGVLRKIVQERSNFGLVVAGLASASVEASELYQRPNPLFSFARPYYIGPFDDSECSDLLRGVGRQVGLNWTDEAIQLAIAETGGSAMLLRELGSAVLRQYPLDRAELVSVDRATVAASLGDWRRSVSSNLREIVLHLQRFYPDETALIEVLMSSTEDFETLAYDYPDQVQRLERLGVIEEVANSWVPSRVLQMGWELVARSDPGRPSVEPIPAPPQSQHEVRVPVEQLLQSDEGPSVERKLSATYNARSKNRDDALEGAVVKSVAGFMNSAGGNLVIGVSDDGEVIGLEADFKCTSRRQDRDGFENWLVTMLCNQIGKSAIAEYVSVEFHEVGDRIICLVRALPSDEPVYVGTEAAFFVRVGNSTREYNPREANEYIRKHW